MEQNIYEELIYYQKIDFMELAWVTFLTFMPVSQYHISSNKYWALNKRHPLISAAPATIIILFYLFITLFNASKLK